MNQKKIDYINNGTTTIPVGTLKFVNVSRYAWSMMAMDERGDLYGCGHNYYWKHTGHNLDIRSVLTKFTPNITMGRVFKFAEGYNNASFIDEHGNLYATGQYPAESMWAKYVDFPFTKVSFYKFTSTPADTQHMYTGAGARLTVEIYRPELTTSPKVKYVKIYDDNPYYQLTFAENEGAMLEKILNKGTNPQLLLSQAYGLPTSKYYANPKISKAVFDAAYASATPSDRGELVIQTPRDPYIQYALNGINKNCMIWLQTEGVNNATTVTNRMVYLYNNFYKSVYLYQRGIVGATGQVLYAPELIPGNYGMYYNSDGTFYNGVPPLGYDTVKAKAKTLDYWMLSPSNQEEAKKVALDNEQYANNDTVITFEYAKNPSRWWNASVYYIKDTDFSPVDVEGDPPVVKPLFAPKDASSFAVGESPFYAPKADGADLAAGYEPIGYIIGDTVDMEKLVKCDFPDGFDPKISRDNEKVYVVYRSDTKKIVEKYGIENADNSITIMPPSLHPQTEANIDQSTDYGPKSAPHIPGYIPIDWSYAKSKLGDLYTEVSPLVRQNAPVNNVEASILNVSDNYIVYYIYKEDKDNNGIPDDYEGTITVNWVGKHGDSSQTNIHQETFTANAHDNEKLYLSENGIGSILKSDSSVISSIDLTISKDKWIFVPPSSEDPYPDNSDSPLEVAFVKGQSNTYTFYYECDFNENNIADKNEGHITEYYQDSVGTKIADETFDKYLEGDLYTKAPPKIRDYVAVDVKVGTSIDNVIPYDTQYPNPPIPNFNVNINGNVVVFVYKTDKNNNGIPDEIETHVPNDQRVYNKFVQEAEGVDTTVTALKAGETYEWKIGLQDFAMTNQVSIPVTFDNTIIEIVSLTPGEAFDSRFTTSTLNEIEMRYQLGTVPFEEYIPINTDGKFILSIVKSAQIHDPFFSIPLFQNPLAPLDSELFFIVKFKVKDTATIGSSPNFQAIQHPDRDDFFTQIQYAYEQILAYDEVEDNYTSSPKPLTVNIINPLVNEELLTMPFILKGVAQLGSKTRINITPYNYLPRDEIDLGIKVDFVHISTNEIESTVYTDKTGTYLMPIPANINLENKEYMLKFSRMGNNNNTLRNESYLGDSLILFAKRKFKNNEIVVIDKTVILTAGSLIANSDDKSAITPADAHAAKAYVGLSSSMFGYDQAVDINEYSGIDGGDYNIVRSNVGKTRKNEIYEIN